MAALRASDADLFSINPLAVSRYRDRYSPSRAKSDPGDAIVLANILRTDMDSHRRLPDDSDGAQAIRVLARVHKDAIWDRQQIVSKARSLLRQYFPAFLQTFEDLSTMGARTVLRLAPTPAAAALRPGWTPARRRRRSSADRRRSACAPPSTAAAGGNRHGTPSAGIRQGAGDCSRERCLAGGGTHRGVSGSPRRAHPGQISRTRTRAGRASSARSVTTENVSRPRAA